MRESRPTRNLEPTSGLPVAAVLPPADLRERCQRRPIRPPRGVRRFDSRTIAGRRHRHLVQHARTASGLQTDDAHVTANGEVDASERGYRMPCADQGETHRQVAVYLARRHVRSQQFHTANPSPRKSPNLGSAPRCPPHVRLHARQRRLQCPPAGCHAGESIVCLPRAPGHDGPRKPARASRVHSEMPALQAALVARLSVRLRSERLQVARPPERPPDAGSGCSISVLRSGSRIEREHEAAAPDETIVHPAQASGTGGRADASDAGRCGRAECRAARRRRPCWLADSAPWSVECARSDRKLRTCILCSCRARRIEATPNRHRHAREQAPPQGCDRMLQYCLFHGIGHDGYDELLSSRPRFVAGGHLDRRRPLTAALDSEYGFR